MSPATAITGSVDEPPDAVTCGETVDVAVLLPPELVAVTATSTVAPTSVLASV
jgi:hypothetical protein